MKKMLAACAALTLLSVAPSAAQIVVEANGARADNRWGGELGAGYAIKLLPRLNLTPAAGVLVFADDNNRYQYYNNGGSSRACRDTTNGRYADDDLCGNTRVKAYGRAELTYDVPLFATVGAGARIGDEVKPYGTIALPIAPKLQIKGNAGDDYYALGLHLRF